MKRIPILPTIVVAVAVATMIGLGVWQIQRAAWKERLIAAREAAGLQHARLACTIDSKPEVRAGRSSAGESGYRYIVPCSAEANDSPRIDIGWSKRPDLLPRVTIDRPLAVAYAAGEERPVMILEKPVPPLEPSALPSPADLPNNHMFYAVQWFFFALAAAIIYVLALRRRQRP